MTMLTTLPLDEALDVYFQRGQDVLADPYAMYARLRSEDPVHRRDRPATYYIITCYDYVAEVLQNPLFSSNRDYAGTITAMIDRLPDSQRSQGRAIQQIVKQMVLSSDGATHTFLRRLLREVISSLSVDQMRGPTEQIVKEILDPLVEYGEMEVLTDFAGPFAAHVIMGLLGVPVADRNMLRKWADDILHFFDGTRGVDIAYPSMLAIDDYLKNLADERRRQPTKDLVSALMVAEKQGDQLRWEEILANILNLIFAGYETVAALIGNGLLALLHYPDQLRLLRDNPNLMGSAIEEMIRYDGPDQGTLRVATEDCIIGDKEILAGQSVSLWLGAANHDPAHFPAPDRLDIARTENRHLGFGHGGHYCLGVGFARMEARVAFTALLEGVSDISLDTHQLEWKENLTLRSLKALPVRIHR